jgi:hypothetical protein
MPSKRHRISADSSQNNSNLLLSSGTSSRNPVSVRSNITLVNSILVLRVSSSVVKLSGVNLSGVGDPSLQAVNLEDIPRPVPMHTLVMAKEIQEMCSRHELT